MADRMHRESRNLRNPPWRNLMLGGLISAVVGIFILALRKLLMGPAPDTASRTVSAGAEAHQTPPQGYQPENPKTAFEPTDWELRPIAVIYIGTLVLLVISCLVLIPAYPDALPDVGRTLRINPPGPRLQTDPAADLRRFRDEEDKRLNGYYWLDKQKGTAHIPIERAMQKLAGTGIPGFP